MTQSSTELRHIQSATTPKSFKEISRWPEFEKDLKKLAKRFRTIDGDLELFLKVALIAFHRLKEDSGGIVQLRNFGFERPKIYKARKCACRALKGRGAQSGIRIVYAFFEDEDTIELIEVYFKGDKENEDRKRIEKKYDKS